MIYILLGEDAQAKDNKISQIKSSLIPDPQAIPFDFESLDAQHLSAANLKKSLMALPVIAKKRLVLIRHAQQLKSDPIKVLEWFLGESCEDCEIILEAWGNLKDDFSAIVSKAKVFSFGITPEANIFDMTKLMANRKTTEALKMLDGFYDQGMYPLQMMGALVWYWGKEGKALGTQKFQKGLKALEEADYNIKRSRLIPEYALEKLVVELVEIQKGLS